MKQSPPSPLAATRGIGMKDKIGYAMGDVGSCLVFGLVQSVLQRFYTDILQISIVSIMLMMVVARIWDAVNDPIWGRIIDNARVGSDGRYRRWIKIFAVPVAVSAVLMFIKIPGLSENGYLIYAYVTYILFGMLYTCINIPYINPWSSVHQVSERTQSFRVDLTKKIIRDML